MDECYIDGCSRLATEYVSSDSLGRAVCAGHVQTAVDSLRGDGVVYAERLGVPGVS